MSSDIANAFENAKKQIRGACDLYEGCHDDTNKYELISHHSRVIEIQIPVHMDDGHVEVFTGYRAQHNDARGPFK